MSKHNKFNIDVKLFNDEYFDVVLCFDEKTDLDNMSCGLNLYTDGLICYIDTTNPLSWDGNTDYSVVSLVSYPQAIVSANTISNNGLTFFDYGKSSVMSGTTLNINYTDRYLKLNSVKYNNVSGNTFPLGTVASGSTTNGNYLTLSGGSYFNNYFKLDSYNYEILPYRYQYGLTIETQIELTNNLFGSITGYTDGFFLFLGAKAENKYLTSYTGRTYVDISGNTITTSGETFLNTTLGTPLNPISGSTDFNSDLYENVFGFKFNQDKSITFRFVNEFGDVNEYKSFNTITDLGWSLISIVYKPYGDIKNFNQNKACTSSREGSLEIYVNGEIFFSLENIKEIWFKSLNESPDKIIGVPYNISWGGGSYGLKNSYRIDETNPFTYYHPTNVDNLLIESNFNGSINTNIQKLRIYEKPLDFTQIRNNYRYEQSLF